MIAIFLPSRKYILLADIVLATPSTVFQDNPHFELGIVSGDGVHLLWQEVIGTIRGRYLILTRAVLRRVRRIYLILDVDARAAAGSADRVDSVRDIGFLTLAAG
jgi:enoyl-CoA hydratase/carnithine racemase